MKKTKTGVTITINVVDTLRKRLEKMAEDPEYSNTSFSEFLGQLVYLGLQEVETRKEEEAARKAARIETAAQSVRGGGTDYKMVERFDPKKANK